MKLSPLAQAELDKLAAMPAHERHALIEAMCAYKPYPPIDPELHAQALERYGVRPLDFTTNDPATIAAFSSPAMKVTTDKLGVTKFIFDNEDATKPPIWDLVIADMNARDAMGERKYGTRLKPHNGRDVLKDAYEEALDLAVYLRQALYERDAK